MTSCPGTGRQHPSTLDRGVTTGRLPEQGIYSDNVRGTLSRAEAACPAVAGELSTGGEGPAFLRWMGFIGGTA